MAYFRYNGVDAIEAGLDTLGQMSGDEKWSVIYHGAQVLADKLAETIEELGLVDTGQLLEGIGIKRSGGDDPVALISSYGKRKGGYTGARKRALTGKGEAIRYGKHKREGRYNGKAAAGSYQGSNTELIYFLEYGTPRMSAKHPLEKTAAKVDEGTEFEDAIMEGWDEYLKFKNL